MKWFKNSLLLLVLILLITACGVKEGKDQQNDESVVYTSFYPLEYMAERIAGGKIKVHNIMALGASVHGWEPTAKDMAGLSDADLLIINGLGLEPWLDDVRGSVSTTIIDSSNGVDAIVLQEEDHDHGDHDHGEYDPHIWLAPKNAIIQSENIKNAFVDLVPEEKEYFEKNFEELTMELEGLDAQFAHSVGDFNAYIIVPHEAFGYLARDYGFKQVPIEGIHSDTEPDLQKMTELTDFAKDHHISTVFYEEGDSPKIPQAIAKEIGADIEGISTIEARTQEQIDAEQDYLTIMKENIEKIIEAIK
ncbi:MAG: zinc ABC transporter substrate-binding protein [Tissierellia bacterium]|nr:zinc ABC transporter substrate-binding protein [Tissierellia bacterium]